MLNSFKVASRNQNSHIELNLRGSFNKCHTSVDCSTD